MNAPVWQSERDVFWTATEGGFFTAAPCIVSISSDALTVERWFSFAFLLTIVRLLALLRMLRGAKPVIIEARDVLALRLEKNWSDFSIEPERDERRMYRMTIERAGGGPVKLNLHLRKTDLEQIRSIPWIKAIVVGP